MARQDLIFGWPGLEGAGSKPRGFLRVAQSSPGHPTPILSSDGALADFLLSNRLAPQAQPGLFNLRLA